MDAPLTGRDATEALRLYMALGRTRTRFDASYVASRVRSRFGRALIVRSLATAARVVLAAPRRSRRSRVARSLRRPTLALASPGRPPLDLGEAT